ncbi:unnamed protein product [Didymodactylos carnosus]|uniref:phosphatidylinositol-3,5-bisphosphate 3-phosphatase n=1 Tax=Didymodactylos carnosus TaxID=1234261 RepID=A0A8S2GYW5_9BILA|nr:unnamed protein product [Didymodactylos carnosus]CAF3555914.1 unnamed protein product [Didymodactylos carnosus]
MRYKEFEDDDLHVINELPALKSYSVNVPSNGSNSTIEPSSTNVNELPFELLPGEDVIHHCSSADGLIYLTCYRLFIFSNDSSFINCPTRLIDYIEIKDNLYLYVHCKDIRYFRLTFFTGEKCSLWFKKISDSISPPLTIDDLFAVKFAQATPIPEGERQTQHNRDRFQEEISRLQLDSHPWRSTSINKKYKLCSSYPEYCIVPASITDEELNEVAKFRSYRRFPTVVWRHQNGAVIARTSQPEVGWLFWRSKEDEKMIAAIIESCGTDPNPIANRAKGGGFEYPPYYTDCEVQFMNLPNIHAIRKSAQTLRASIASGPGECWLSQLESSRWLHNISLLLAAASFVATAIDKQSRPVLVHCSDGWDRTPQITALAQIMLDPHYRTIEGFQTLIQREWIAFGHKFADRCGHGVGATDPNERSPVFLQWLDCVYQLQVQNPVSFEFNEMFLLKLASHTYTCLHGTFLCNTDFERFTVNLEKKTHSVWSLLNMKLTHLINHLFDDTKKEALYPSYSVRDLKIWTNLYLRDTRFTPSIPCELPSSTSSLVPRCRSYEDLSSSVLNGLHRSSSDPSLGGSMESSITLRTGTTPPITISNHNVGMTLQHQNSGHLLNSNSSLSNSLFGPPHHLGETPSQNGGSNSSLLPALSSIATPSIATATNSLINGHRRGGDYHHHHHLNNSATIYDSVVDSAPNIPQLSLSQKFSSNTNTVLKPMSARKHTNSTSSTTSSLSEAWSLPKISSLDNNNTPHKMLQHLSSSSSYGDKSVKSVRKRIDIDGLTKINDVATLRMLQKERTYVNKIEELHDHVRKLERVLTTIIKYNIPAQNVSPRMDNISQSPFSTTDSSSCASWQKIDTSDTIRDVTRWIPDFSVEGCQGCSVKFFWPVVRKHHCRRCGDVFCHSCAKHYKPIPTLNLLNPVRVCDKCYLLIEDINSDLTSPLACSPVMMHNALSSSPKQKESTINLLAAAANTTVPVPIQTQANDCRQQQQTTTSNTFNSTSQKVKG